jgi:hypothetical protein
MIFNYSVLLYYLKKSEFGESSAIHNFLYPSTITTARWSSGQCARRAIAEAKHRSQWPVLGWVIKNLLSRAPPCFGRHVKPLVPLHLQSLAPTNPHWARVVGYGPFSLWVIHKEGLCPISRDINRLMMTIISF